MKQFWRGQKSIHWTYRKKTIFFSLIEKVTTLCPAATVLERWKQVFALSPNHKCVQFIFQHDLQSPLYKNTKLTVFASADKDGPQDNMGSVDLKMVRFFPIHANLIWLPENQNFTTIKDKSLMVAANILGPFFLSVSKQGSFINYIGVKFELQVSFEQGSGLINILSSSPNGELTIIL